MELARVRTITLYYQTQVSLQAVESEPVRALWLGSSSPVENRNHFPRVNTEI